MKGAVLLFIFTVLPVQCRKLPPLPKPNEKKPKFKKKLFDMVRMRGTNPFSAWQRVFQSSDTFDFETPAPATPPPRKPRVPTVHAHLIPPPAAQAPTPTTQPEIPQEVSKEFFEYVDEFNYNKLSNATLRATNVFPNANFTVIKGQRQRNVVLAEHFHESAFPTLRSIFQDQDSHSNFACKNQNQSQFSSVSYFWSAREARRFHGPCELWINTAKVLYHDDCAQRFPNGELLNSVDVLSHCNGSDIACSLSLFRMHASSLQGANHVKLFYQCIPNAAVDNAITVAQQQSAKNQRNESVVEVNDEESIENCSYYE